MGVVLARLVRLSGSGLFVSGRTVLCDSCAEAFVDFEGRGAGASPGGQEPEAFLHGLTTAGAGNDVRGLFFDGCRSSDEEGAPGVEGNTLAFVFGSGVAVAVVAHGSHAAGQDVAQVAFGKFGSGDGVGFFCVAVGAVFPAEGDVGAGDGEDAGVADGCAADVATEVFDDVFPIAKWLKVDTPVFFPDGGIDDGESGMVLAQGGESIAEAGAEDGS